MRSVVVCGTDAGVVLMAGVSADFWEVAANAVVCLLMVAGLR